MSEHKAVILSVEPAGDGHLTVRARCCGDASTESVLTLLELQRPAEAIDQDVADHLARIEKMHAARDFAKAHVERLMQR